MRKKRIRIAGLIVGLLVVFVSIVFLSRMEFRKKSQNYRTLSLSKLESVDQDFVENIFLAWNMKKEDICEKNNISFFDEAFSLNDIFSNPQLNFHGVHYVVYVNSKPLCVQYEDYTGHLICGFKDNSLTGIYIIFSDAAESRNIQMDYDGTQNDMEILYSQLCKDYHGYASEKYGLPFSVNTENETEGIGWNLDDQKVIMILKSRPASSQNSHVILMLQNNGR